MRMDALIGRGMVALSNFPRKLLCLEPQLGRCTGCGRVLRMYKKANCKGAGSYVEVRELRKTFTTASRSDSWSCLSFKV